MNIELLLDSLLLPSQWRSILSRSEMLEILNVEVTVKNVLLIKTLPVICTLIDMPGMSNREFALGIIICWSKSLSKTCVAAEVPLVTQCRAESAVPMQVKTTSSVQKTSYAESDVSVKEPACRSIACMYVYTCSKGTTHSIRDWCNWYSEATNPQILHLSINIWKKIAPVILVTICPCTQHCN